MKRISAMEILWILVAAVSIFLGVSDTISRGIGKSYPFVIIAVLAIAMFSLRKKMRENMDKRAAEEEQNK